MSSNGPRFDPAHRLLRTLSCTSQPDILSLCRPTQGLNTVLCIITQDLTGILMLVNYLILLACFNLYLTI